jgi:AcrR family transcriptional regulator
MGIQERREREKAELRRTIIRTASELISREGHEQLTIRKLARAIEYSPRTIYLYFRDKEHLLHEVVEEGFRRTLELRQQDPPMGDLSPEEVMEHRLRSHFRAALSDHNFYRAVVTLLFEKNFPLGPAQRDVIEQSRRDIAAMLPDERQSEEEIAALALIIFSAVRGFALTLINLEEQLAKAQLQALIDRFVTFARDGVRAAVR